MLTLITYCLVGAIVGVLAGLLGVGGGGIIVPILVYLLPRQDVSQDIIMHLALGTSLACIIFSSISSLKAHHLRGAVHWNVVFRIAPGIITGTLIGSTFASMLSTRSLTIFFSLFLYFISVQMLINRKPKPSCHIPGLAGLFTTGNVIGFISSLVGIGGGSLSVPFMVWCNISMHHAIGTSAAIGLPIAAAGTLGYLINGWGTAGLPDYAIGFIYLPALFGIAAISIITAPLGAKLAHSLPVGKLAKIFAVLLIMVATKMLFDII